MSAKNQHLISEHHMCKKCDKSKIEVSFQVEIMKSGNPCIDKTCMGCRAKIRTIKRNLESCKSHKRAVIANKFKRYWESRK